MIGLYIWEFITKTSLESSLSINNLVVILASIAALLSLIALVWQPEKYFLPIDLIIYLLITASIGSLVISTGGIASPFIILATIVILFANVFGFWGSIPTAIAIVTLLSFQYLDYSKTKVFNYTQIIVAMSSMVLPFIISLIVWHSHKNHKIANNNAAKNYRNLASELSEVASKSEVVINAIGDGVIAIDNNGIIQLINPAAQIATGWSKEDAVALNYKSVIQLIDMKGEVIDESANPITQALNTNSEIRTSNLTLVTKTNKKIMVSLVASPVSSTASGVIVVFHDITKEKAEEREQAEFISTASHEMRTPVASIEGYLGLALNPNTAQMDERARDFITKAHLSAEHLGRLFQDLLDVTKADDNRISNNPTVINMVDFVQNIVQDLSQEAAKKGIKINFVPKTSALNEKIVTPAYSVYLDKDHVLEVLDNIIENAIKYTPAGQIDVDVTGDDDHVAVSVKDSGIGIPAEDMPHLFQKFYRVADKSTNDIGGTGLGLYLSRRLTEIMGGRIWAESKYGSGSTFFVQLPRLNDQEAENIANQQQLQPVQQPQSPEPVKAAKEVPRGESLTPEQIAAYVAQQRALAHQQNSPEEVVQNNVQPQPTQISPTTRSNVSMAMPERPANNGR